MQRGSVSLSIHKIKQRLQPIFFSKNFKIIAPICVLVLVLLGLFISDSGITSANARGDGVLLYGVSANSNPQQRAYSGSANTLSSAANTVAGTNPPLDMVVRASSTKQEMVAGYTTTAGVLQIMCYNGTTWTNEWTVTVGGTGTTRRFDIAYESNSGNVVVMYSTNTSTTNELAYRTKSGSTGCGSANWSGATNVDPVRTSGTIAWVKLAADSRGSSNLIAAMWADTGSSASAMIWSGSAWGNEPSSAIATGGGAAALERIGATQDVQSFDLAYESSSGDLMITWSVTGTGTTNLLKYTTCTGGTSTCSWPGTLISNIGTVADSGTNMDLASNPNTDEISMVALDDGGGANSCDMSAGYWSGTGWTGYANVDTTAECPTAGQQVVSTAWFVSGATTRWVISYDDSTGTGISYKYANGSGAITSPADFAASPAINDVRAWYDFQADPFNQNRAMLTVSDSTSSLFSKQLTMDSSANFTWSNTEGGSALTTTLAQAAGGDFSFAYWRATSTYTQTSYRWYDNADNVQPNSALANQNTAASIGSNATIVRLRMGLTIATADMDASSQAFKLQYGTSTSGPWTDVDSNQNTWCNDTVGILCNTTWSSRRKITINSSSLTASVSNYPLLIKLNSGRVDYSKTQNAGQDIRFVDPSDPNTVLPCQIEKWDESGNSYVWVKIPQIDAASSADYLWMYYGNASASDGQDAANVWDSNFRGVYHASEITSATSLADSTSNANNMTTKSNLTGATGQISGAQSFNGTNSTVSAPDNATLDLTTFTVSAWINATTLSAGNWKTIACKDASGNPNYCMQIEPSNHLDFNACSSSCGTFAEATGTTTLVTGSWYYVTGTYDGSSIRVYVNGTDDSGSSTTTFTPLNSTAAFALGQSSAGERWSGLIDEPRVSTSARSPSWIKADYLSQSDTMLSFGSEEDQTIDYTAGKWKFYHNPTAASGATITTLLLGGATTKQSYQEANPTASNPTATPIGGVGEWDFALDPGSICGGTYYFRMVKDDGTTFTTYTNYPQLTINIPAIVPIDKVMRGGKWFNNETKQPYGCEWVSSH